MSQNTAPTSPGTSGTSAKSGWAEGGTLFAGILLAVVGVIGILEGIAGIAEDDVYVRIGSYIYSWDLTAWGWIHLIIGILAVIAGFGILKGMEWGRALGIALASLNIILQFLFLPYAPVWAIFSMAISVFVIWALATDKTPAKV
ncbi:DUF7144 family membrane protein [Streptomyces sp. NPDC001970]